MHAILKRRRGTVAGLAATVWLACVPAGLADDAIPVTTVQAARQDVPVYLPGIGSVAPLNSALIRPRVDGTLDSLAFTEGQDVHAGDLLAIIDPRPYQAALDQAEAKRAQDQAGLTNAGRDLARNATLAQQAFASRQTVDTGRSNVQAGQAQIAADDAAIAAAALNLAFTHITSPIDGRVGLRLLNPGNLVHASDSAGIVSVTQLHPIGVVFTLPETAMADITAARAAAGAEPLQVLADDPQSHAPLAQGRLLATDNAIDDATGTIKLKAVFQNDDNRLWPGQFIAARLRLRTLKGALTVPERAIQHGRDGLFVYVVKPDQTVELRPVRQLQEQDDTVVIASGLAAGETVVVGGQSRLAAGVRVSAQAGS